MSAINPIIVKLTRRQCYQILEINHEEPSQTAMSLNDLRKSYLKVAKKNHPDKNRAADSTYKFQLVAAAYHKLLELQERGTYQDDSDEEDVEGNDNASEREYGSNNEAFDANDCICGHVSSRTYFDFSNQILSFSHALATFQHVLSLILDIDDSMSSCHSTWDCSDFSLENLSASAKCLYDCPAASPSRSDTPPLSSPSSSPSSPSSSPSPSSPTTISNSFSQPLLQSSLLFTSDSSENRESHFPNSSQPHPASSIHPTRPRRRSCFSTPYYSDLSSSEDVICSELSPPPSPPPPPTDDMVLGTPPPSDLSPELFNEPTSPFSRIPSLQPDIQPQFFDTNLGSAPIPPSSFLCCRSLSGVFIRSCSFVFVHDVFK